MSAALLLVTFDLTQRDGSLSQPDALSSVSISGVLWVLSNPNRNLLDSEAILLPPQWWEHCFVIDLMLLLNHWMSHQASPLTQSFLDLVKPLPETLPQKRIRYPAVEQMLVWNLLATLSSLNLNLNLSP